MKCKRLNSPFGPALISYSLAIFLFATSMSHATPTCSPNLVTVCVDDGFDGYGEVTTTIQLAATK